MVNDGIEKSRQKTFDEARSEIVNEYQAILEANMLERLRKQYRVSSYKERLSNAFIEEKAASMNKPTETQTSLNSSTLH